MEAIVYVRWSTRNQDDGDSLNRQLSLARNLATRKGWTIVEEHIEKGKSAYHGRNRAERGELRKLEERAERGELAGKVLIVEAMDRLSRQEPLESLNLLSGLCKRGLTIYEADSDTLYDSAKISAHWQNLIVPLAKAGEAHDSSKLKATRVRSAWRKTQANGFTKDGTADPRLCPAWMEVIDGQFTPIASRAAIIRKCFQMSVDGHGYKAIAAYANEQHEKHGWPTRRWDIRTVSILFKDRRVLGEYQPKTRVGTNDRTETGAAIKLYPAVVPLDLYHRVQDAVKSRTSTGGPRAKASNVLSHLARCTYINPGQNVPCGSKLTMRPQKKGPTQMACSSFIRGRGCQCNANYRYTDILNGILEHILPLAARITKPLENSAAGKIAMARAEIATKRARLEQMADRLMDRDDEFLFAAFERSKASLAEDTAALKAMEQASDHKESQLTPSQIAAEVATLRENMDDAETRQKVQSYLDQLIDTILMDPSDRSATVVMLEGHFNVKLGKHGELIGVADALRMLQPISYPDADGNMITLDPRPEGRDLADPLRASAAERVIGGLNPLLRSKRESV
ncbi:recombinase family protein [Novosphingobium profundi]|uniref:recombinase family protein n=1 Tax=Novosphingobium profundi TaxID=1774954 RepID=UPI001BDB0C54|nr:recombinase family protein [Novosphingobium profundi]MBT0671294.1 recombinase family protein [Novosphingobium profundi]